MRIARVVSRLNLGGPARQILASDPWLLARGHQVRVFTGRTEPGEGDLTERLAERGVDVVRIPGLRRAGGALDNLRALGSLRRELRAFAPEIVHTHASKAGLLGRLVAPGGAQRIHTFHGHVLEGYFSAPASKALAGVERHLARRCARVLAVSAATARDLERLGVVPSGGAVVCPPGIDLAPFLALDEGARRAARAELDIGEAPAIGLVGRLAAVKRPALAGAVLRRLQARGRRVHLCVAGDGPERDALLRAAGPAARRVHLLGATERPELVHAAVDVVVGTSSSEGLPVAFVEAAAAARPIVSTAVGGVAEIVDDGVTGTLVRSSSTAARIVEDLTLALERWLDDAAARRRAGAVARARAAGLHSAAALGERLECVYAAALAERADVAHGRRPSEEARACAS